MRRFQIGLFCLCLAFASIGCNPDGPDQPRAPANGDSEGMSIDVGIDDTGVDVDVETRNE